MMWESIFEVMKDAISNCVTEDGRNSIKKGCKVFSGVMLENNVFTEEDYNNIMKKIENMEGDKK